MIGAIAATMAAVLLIGGVLSYIFLFSPAALAKKTSSSFMKAATTHDTTKLYKLADAENDTDSKRFLDNASNSVSGNFSLKEKTNKDSKWFFLYNLTNADKKEARTIVEKKDGKWIVSSFVYSKGNLALVPGTSSSTDTTSSSTQTTPSQPRTSTLACLTQDDYKYMNYDKQPSSVTFDTTYDPSNYTNNHINDMFFEPDSLKEASFTSFYDDWTDFASHASTKQWKFRLEGSTYGSDASAATSKKLANDRASKVKSELMSRGVPADRIVIDSPHDYGSEIQDERSNEIYRRVEVVIDPTCNNSGAGSSSGSNR